MEIKHKFDCVDGNFDTNKGEIICVGNNKYGRVNLCFKANMNIPFAQIKLFSKDLAIDADAVFDDACNLGKEIARRWNLFPALIEEIDSRINILTDHANKNYSKLGRHGFLVSARSLVMFKNFIKDFNDRKL